MSREIQIFRNHNIYHVRSQDWSYQFELSLAFFENRLFCYNLFYFINGQSRFVSTDLSIRLQKFRFYISDCIEKWNQFKHRGKHRMPLKTAYVFSTMNQIGLIWAVYTTIKSQLMYSRIWLVLFLLILHLYFLRNSFVTDYSSIFDFRRDRHSR